MWLKQPTLRLKEEQLEAITDYLSWILSSLSAFYTLIQSFHPRAIHRADSFQYLYKAQVLDCPFYTEILKSFTHQALLVHHEAHFASSHKGRAGISPPCLAPAAGHCSGILGMQGGCQGGKEVPWNRAEKSVQGGRKGPAQSLDLYCPAPASNRNLSKTLSISPNWLTTSSV